MATSDIYTRRSSLTDWYERADLPDAEAFRIEDNGKLDRLRVLHDVIGLPYNEGRTFRLSDVLNGTSDEFRRFAETFGNRPCGLRANPSDPRLSQRRVRGLSIPAALAWLKDQALETEAYYIEISPHIEEADWSTIFVATHGTVIGEIIKGGHHHLTQEVPAPTRPIRFWFEDDGWRLSEEVPGVRAQLDEIRLATTVVDRGAQAELERRLDASFDGDQLTGYFETIKSVAWGLRFIDYNRRIARLFDPLRQPIMLPDSDVQGEVEGSSAPAGGLTLNGIPASPGTASGRARVVLNITTPEVIFKDGEILVCPVTTPDHVELIQKAAGVVTDIGGMLSHAAIICRELGKPCAAGVGTATQVIRDGDQVMVFGDTGRVMVGR